ncbi:microsomal signal peptidase subunit [Heterostelium album PN500]|uniref:Signal peptidase complex subunit 3 n=1 Tax=Heterostelium pallidum (strain ATCC 26659 / Pp 5 / PN500) TaxID=670386 RepID=D3BFL2_HETP5|nr:microsomal signal peptidase subunit [Heterostelium album PN500]EFA79926.1 microsomal signal peptidase subunit [Heterostelium album PN500]|eukprot:XP_020432046.1 microsomal signal peptidase subunit [Heterostelium album PN500]
MHSVSQRANLIVCFGGVVLFGVLLLNVLSRSFFPDHIDVNLTGSTIKFVKRNPVELAQVHMSLQADLTPLFNWNTKQLFLYITAEYQTKETVVSQVVLWDYILKDKSKAVLKEKDLIKYLLIDHSGDLRGQNVTLTFNYNVIPISGLITRHKEGSYSFKMPTEYIN